MYCWGEYLGGTDVGDQYGDGIGVVVMADSFRFLTLAAGNGHVCGVATTTETICWGSYLSGKRGQNGPYELNNEGSSFSDLNANAVAGGQSFIRLAAGDRQTCGISAAGNLFCWGDSVSVGVPGFAFEQADSLCYDSDACAMTPVLVPQLFSIASAEAGGAQTCALTTTGTVFCWGYNYYGEVGNGSSAPQSSPVVIDIGEPAQAISAGGFHTCALGLSGSAYCWGVNELGQLGFAGPDHPTPRKVLFHKNFVSLSAGVAHTCGISVEGFIYCWGDNQAGELGNGSTVSSPFPQKVVEP
jgi:alpha-tubulin suppressor-like RCC1 family protein